MKTLNQIKELLNDKLDENKQSIDAKKNNIMQTEQCIKAINDDLVKAQENEDFKAYDEAKKSLWTAENTKDLQIKQLEKMQQTKIISPEEAKELHKEVLTLANAARKMQFRRASELLQELKEISDQSLELKELTNELLKLIKNDLRSDFTPVYSISDEYKPDMVYGLYGQIKDTPMFEPTMKEGLDNDRT
ncbi:hypothetical protein ACYSNU_04910 [Enterococcus sp. LJL120]